MLENLIKNNIQTNKQLELSKAQTIITPQDVTVSEEFQEAMSIWEDSDES
ncbi:hypothetical protein ACQTPQ_08740 [Streptococcus hyovaginalis]